MDEDEDLPPVSAAESLRLIEQEQAGLERALTPDPRFMYGPWGLAWLIGFGLFFLRFGPDGRVFVDLPDWLPLLVLLGLIIAAGVVTGIVGARTATHVSGNSSARGLMYGLTWSIAFAGMSVVFAQFNGLLSDEQQSLLWAGGMVALTGALHMAGGAVWNDRPQFVLGVWTSVVNVVGMIAGSGWHSLVVAVAGGGGMLVAGVIGWRKVR